MPKWTREQQAAIDARNHAILVSAAAGSGKTAVLVERIVCLLREGYHLDRMLIVTFTRAAAAEMRQRLNQRIAKEALIDHERMGKALDELESAEISTIHSFCQKVIKNDFQAVGVDPLTRVCDEHQRTQLFDQAFCDAMNMLLEDEKQKNFHLFADSFDQQEIKDMAGRLYTFLMSLPNPFEWLEEKINSVNKEPYEEHPWYAVLVDHGARQVQALEMHLQAMERMFKEADAVHELHETWLEDCKSYQKLMAMEIQNPKVLREGLQTYTFKTAVRCKKLTAEQEQWKKRFTRQRDEMKKLVKESAAALSLDEEKIQMEFPAIQKELQGLGVLIKKIHELFAAYKQQQNVMDFSDMEQMTLHILQQEKYKERLQQEYDHIFVDECQDVSAVQDAIVQSIHGEQSCLFMVGDVKQSIYRFRLADPTLFLTRMRTYSDEEGARERRIFLQKNFRSRGNILDAANRVFRKTMKSSVTEIDYLPEDELIAGRTTENDPGVEIHLVDPKGEEDEAIGELEAESRVVVERIKLLLTQTLEEENRPYQYRDMVILLPKVARIGSALAELLEQQGVPVFFDGAESYFGLPEIQSMKALLSVLDNPMQDIPLMAALKMPPFQMTDENLASIRLCKMGKDVPFHEAFLACCEEKTPLGEKCRNAWNSMQDWRFRAECMRMSDFVWYLIRETGFYAACGALPEGALRQANLRLLCQRTAEYEQNGGVTLGGLIKQMEMQQQAGDSRSAKNLGENENLVRIMTIHKSKGLEFPVVFCLQMSGKIHLPNRSGLKMHSRLGVCLPYINRKLNIRRNTMADEAFDIQRMLDEKAERARLMYVAMTRARDRLILVGCAPKEGRPNWDMPEGDFRIWDADSMLDWLMASVKQELSTDYPQAETPWKVRVWDQFNTEGVEKNKVIHSLAKWLGSVVSLPAVDNLGITWKEHAQKESMLPLKTSVTSLTKKEVMQDPLPLKDDDESAEDKRQGEEIVAPLRLSELPSRPAFMEEKHMTGAERGTLVHKALSLIDLEAVKNAESIHEAIWQEITRLEETNCLRKDEADVISQRSLIQFYESNIGRRLLQSDNVRREWSFNLKLDEKGTLLQGVIDCAFEEKGQWVIVDYKTDRMMDERAFVERYRMQLAWYGRALEKITGKPVKEMWLYALQKNKAYQVSQEGDVSRGTTQA